jgi:nicotinamidase-related amidase
METLPFGPLTDPSLHLCIDMQNLFARGTPWHTPWMERVLPVDPHCTASSRPHYFHPLCPPDRPDQMAGSWRRYYEHWRNLTLERLDSELIELVPALAALCPPATVIHKSVYSASSRSLLPKLLRRRGIDSLIITGAETDVCILAPALDAVDLGYRTVIARDALCSSSDAAHDALLTLYHDRFSQQIETAHRPFWRRGCDPRGTATTMAF